MAELILASLCELLPYLSIWVSRGIWLRDWRLKSILRQKYLLKCSKTFHYLHLALGCANLRPNPQVGAISDMIGLSLECNVISSNVDS